MTNTVCSLKPVHFLPIEQLEAYLTEENWNQMAHGTLCLITGLVLDPLSASHGLSHTAQLHLGREASTQGCAWPKHFDLHPYQSVNVDGANFLCHCKGAGSQWLSVIGQNF